MAIDGLPTQGYHGYPYSFLGQGCPSVEHFQLISQWFPGEVLPKNLDLLITAKAIGVTSADDGMMCDSDYYDDDEQGVKMCIFSLFVETSSDE